MKSAPSTFESAPSTFNRAPPEMRIAPCKLKSRRADFKNAPREIKRGSRRIKSERPDFKKSPDAGCHPAGQDEPAIASVMLFVLFWRVTIHRSVRLWDRMDENLDRMSREQLLAEAKGLRQGIRQHRPRVVLAPSAVVGVAAAAV